MASITKLPVDLRGTLSSNRRVDEVHTLNVANGRVNRMLTPKFGAYFTESLEVRQANGALLKRDVDYVTTYYYVDLGVVTGKEICAIVVITNPKVSSTVRLTYQAYGGPYALSIDELNQILIETETPKDKIQWESITNKPTMYVPADHTHEYWQLYGLETTDFNLEQLGRDWFTGRKPVIDDNRLYYQNKIAGAQAIVNNYQQQVLAHILDQQNPHETDRFKIRLGNVNDWPLANKVQSEDKTQSSTYQPIGGIYNMLTVHVQPILNTHIANRNNPHKVKLTDPLLDLWSSTEITTMFGERLAKTSPAVMTEKVAGVTPANLRAAIRTNLSTVNIDPATRFPQVMLGDTSTIVDVSKVALNGASQYVTFESIFKSYNDKAGSIWFVGSQGGSTQAQADAAIRAFDASKNLSVGTWVIGQWGQDYYGGLRHRVLRLAQKQADGMKFIM